MSFLQPWLLWGIALGAVPVLIHLLSRRRYRVVPWAATEFLLRAVSERSRDLRIQDLVLLTLRAAALAGAALAAARPVLSPSAGGIAGLRAGAVDAAIVLDSSYSMGTVSGGQSRMALARGRAREALETLPRGSRAAVVSSEDPAAPSGAALAGDRASLAAAVDRAEASWGSGGAAAGIEAALGLLRQSGAASRRIFLITDGQARFFEQDARRLSKALEEAPEDIGLTVLLVPAGPEQNLAIADLAIQGRKLRTGAPLEIVATIEDAGEPALSRAAADLWIDGRKVERQKVALEDRRGKAAFRHAFHEAGLHAVEVRLDPDALEADSSRSAAIYIPEVVDIALVEGEEDAAAGASARPYIEAALGAGEGPGDSPALPYALRPRADRARLATELDVDLWVAILSDPGSLPEDVRKGLERLLESGGGLLIAAGPRATETLGAFRSAREGAGSLLGGVSFSAPAGDSGAEGPLRQLAVPGGSGLADLGSPDLQEALRSVNVFRALEAGASPESGFSAALKLSDGRPALLLRGEGSASRPALLGRTALLAFPLDPRWSDLAYRPAFVPVLEETLLWLCGPKLRSPSIRPRESWIASLPDALGKDLQVLLPGGERLDAEGFLEKAGSGSLRLRFDRTERPGVYVLEAGGKGKVLAARAAISVNIDPAESDRIVWTPEMIRSILPGKRIAVVPAGAALAAGSAEAAGGLEVWPHLLLGIVLVLGLETALAHLFGRKALGGRRP